MEPGWASEAVEVGPYLPTAFGTKLMVAKAALQTQQNPERLVGNVAMDVLTHRYFLRRRIVHLRRGAVADGDT